MKTVNILLIAGQSNALGISRFCELPPEVLREYPVDIYFRTNTDNPNNGVWDTNSRPASRERPVGSMRRRSSYSFILCYCLGFVRALPPRPTGTPPKEGNGLLKEESLCLY